MMDPETRKALYEAWVDRVFGAEFKRKLLFRQAEAPFEHSVRSDLTKIIELIFSSDPLDGSTVVPDALVRFRAVQEISAAEAVSYVFVLKDLIRERFGGSSAYQALEPRLDFLALHTFNAYAQCREDLYRMRIRELSEYGASETFACRSSAANPPQNPSLVASQGDS
jgi:hypothetical protein